MIRPAPQMKRMALAAALSLAIFISMTGVAAAHDPIFIADDQTSPDVGPYMPDGTISWALYGQVLEAGDVRGFEFDLRDGDELFISLLIPNLEPELVLDDASLPALVVTRPDGSTLEPVIDQRTVFDEPFSGTSYVTLLEHREDAASGRYEVIVQGNAPSRFSVAVGESEIFFTETERSGDRPSNFMEINAPLQAWYSTPPGGESTGPVAGVGIDAELLDEAMDSGSARLGDGVDEETAMGGPADTETAETETAETEPAETELVDEVESVTTSPAEAEPADTEPAESETAASLAGGDEGSGSTWVAPVAVGGIAVAGAGWFLARRKQTSPS